jgi:hypothetical protein
MQESMVGVEVRGADRSEDRRLASAMLLHLIIFFPERLEMTELIGDFATGGFDAETITATAERLRDEGLVERTEGRVWPTPAAIRSYELWEA